MTKNDGRNSRGNEPDTAPAVVIELIERFAEHADAYHSGRYNETQIRREFIDPFFKALGWDVDNTKGYAEAYKDVIHEDAIKIGGATKAPDYCFRIGGVRKFFVEAKKPSVDIKSDAGPAFQLRRYAWSAKLPLSILTDFEEMAVYDCRIKPVRSDKAGIARVLYLRYDEYATRWVELASVFSREAILKGSFDKYAESTRRKRGTAEVDEAFLTEIEQWRDLLARNLALRNAGLSQRDLNFAVQRTIDRIVFLRICEDRGIEPYGTLQGLINGEQVYARLFERFRLADERYNSGLFHFDREKGRTEAPDDLTPALNVDDKPLKEILARLYYPESAYEFSVLPADILGQVYEQFLGKVIRLTAGHRAVVEEKPEVRKAGGVYYTPTYIVDYIVRHTVGKLVEGRAPQQVGGLTDTYQPSKAKGVRPLAILDPACGSGSFLLGAYQYLLDWYRDRYVEDGPETHAAGRNPRLFQHPSGEWRLTTAERKRILLAHIHGVDIDSQAVETTKLSLLLKVLEGESAETLGANLRLFHERALPDLAANIKCGNSLIGPDFYDNQQLDLFDEEQRLRINVFDWQTEFKDIMQSGGFDAVIGNPPWGASFIEAELTYLRCKYSRVVDRMVDSYIYFLDSAFRILHDDGLLGFIVPSTLLNQVDATSARRLLLDYGIRVIVNLGQRVFGPKVLNTSTVIVAAQAVDRIIQSDLSTLASEDRPLVLNTLSAKDYSSWRHLVENDPHKTFFVGNISSAELLRHLSRNFPLLNDVLKGPIQRGVSPDIVAAHILSDKQVCEFKIEPAVLRPSIAGHSIKRYRYPTRNQWLLYTERNTPIQQYPNAYDFLKRFRADNTCKEVIQGKHPWWALHRPRNPAIFDSPKLIGLTTTKSIELVYDQDCSLYVTDAMYVFSPLDHVDMLSLAAIMQSNTFLFLYIIANQGESRVIPQVKASKLQYLPIPPLDSVAQIDSLRILVQTMLDLHKRLGSVKTAHEKTAIQRQIEATDGQIDRLVYELYGLTDDEIRIVEEATGKP